MLQNFLTSTDFAYVLLGILVLEALGLLALWRVAGKGLPPAQTISFLGAGAGLAGALLIVSKGGAPFLLAASLGIALVFHLMDIWLRWRK